MPHLISFLGTGSYESCRYVHPENGQTFEARFMTAAAARLFDASAVTVIATGEAQQKHGLALIDALAQAALPQPRFVLVAAGRNERELRSNFRILRDEIAGGGDGVILDITHGFRSQPFFAGAVVQHLRALGAAATLRIVYGAFDARDPASGRTPVWDLTAFADLADWTAALHTFEQTGRGQRLADLAARLGRILAGRWAQDGKPGGRPGLDALARALRDFCDAIDAVRVGELLLANGRESSLSRRLRDAISAARMAIVEHVPALDEPIHRLEDWLGPLVNTEPHFGTPDAQRALGALAGRYLSWGRLAEAAVVLREAFTCRYADAVANRPGAGFNRESRAIADRRFASEDRLARQIAAVRNDVEHAGFNSQPLPARTIRDRLGQLQDEFGKTIGLPIAGVPRGKTYLVSRHSGAIEWARRLGLQIDEHLSHLDVSRIQSHDIVIGTLPVNLAAEVCRRHAHYLNLSLDLPEGERGRELDAEDMERYGARLEQFHVAAMSGGGTN